MTAPILWAAGVGLVFSTATIKGLVGFGEAVIFSSFWQLFGGLFYTDTHIHKNVSTVNVKKYRFFGFQPMHLIFMFLNCCLAYTFTKIFSKSNSKSLNSWGFKRCNTFVLHLVGCLLMFFLSFKV